jgi:hypothetical protein
MKMNKPYAIALTLIFLLSVVAGAYILSPIQAQPTLTPKDAQTGTLPGGLHARVGTTKNQKTDQVDLNSWYMTFQGVLAVPGEMPLYPFEHGSTMTPNNGVSSECTNSNPCNPSVGNVLVGFSRYGEPFDPLTMIQDPRFPQGVGFAYVGEHPWCAPPTTDGPCTVYDPLENNLLMQRDHSAGWKLVITYNHPGIGARTVWAYAMFSDGTDWGSPLDGNTGQTQCPTVSNGWIQCLSNTVMPNSPALSPHGGRKTNGHVVTPTSPTILYDSARRVVVSSQNTIYDVLDTTDPDCSQPTSCIAVASLTITMDFNKDMKEVTILKDVKLLLPVKQAAPITGAQCAAAELPVFGFGWKQNAALGGVTPTGTGTGAPLSGLPGLACFELADTEQLDQGNAITGFGHFWTVLGPDPLPTTTKLLAEPCQVGQTAIAGQTFCDPAYHWDTRANVNNNYAVAQLLENPTEEYAIKKGFWPHPDWWTLNAFQGNQITGSQCQLTCMFNKLEGVTDTDTVNPFTTGLGATIVGTSAQWNFILDCSPASQPTCTTPSNRPPASPPGAPWRAQYRAVETFGVTGANDACVRAAGNTGNSIDPNEHRNCTPNAGTGFSGDVIDREFNFLDNMIFNPWDLQSAADKQFDRRVVIVQRPFNFQGVTTVSVPGMIDTATGTTGGRWDAYASFGERVVDVSSCDGQSTDPASQDGCPGEFLLRGPGCDNWLAGSCGADPAINYNYGNSCNGLTCNTIDIVNMNGLPGSFSQARTFKIIYSTAPIDEKMDVKACTIEGQPVACTGVTDVNLQYGPAYNVKFVQGHVTGSGDPGTWTPIPIQVPGVPGTPGYTCEPNQVENDTVGNGGTPGEVTVPCNLAPKNSPSNAIITEVDVNSTSTLCTVGTVAGSCDEYKVVYDTPRGAYEWITVGNTAISPSDSIAASMVSEAFDSLKNVEVNFAALDMQKNTAGFSTLPFLLNPGNLYPGFGVDCPFTSTTPAPASTYNSGHVGASFRTDYAEGVFADQNAVAPPFADPTGLSEGCRRHLRDDYSSLLPVDSSNIITIGGPDVNGVTDLANDLGSAITRLATQDLWGPGMWNGIPNVVNSGKGFSLPYAGHAVIETVMDIDGTFYFIVHGGSAQDTYWASWLLLHDNGGLLFDSSLAGFSPGSKVSLSNLCNGPQGPPTTNSETTGNIPPKQTNWESGSPAGKGCGLVPMEHENPGVTAWIISINYNQLTHIPTFFLEKRLNTFSEKQPQQDP